MNYFVRSFSAVAVLAAVTVGPVSALPMAKISGSTASQPSPLTENVHLVCDRYGRCYNSRRYIQRRYYADPGYSSYGYGPSYGYGYGPGYGYGYGGPSISFGFGGYGHHHHHW